MRLMFVELKCSLSHHHYKWKKITSIYYANVDKFESAFGCGVTKREMPFEKQNKKTPCDLIEIKLNLISLNVSVGFELEK